MCWGGVKDIFFTPKQISEWICVLWQKQKVDEQVTEKTCSITTICHWKGELIVLLNFGAPCFIVGSFLFCIIPHRHDGEDC